VRAAPRPATKSCAGLHSAVINAWGMLAHICAVLTQQQSEPLFVPSSLNTKAVPKFAFLWLVSSVGRGPTHMPVFFGASLVSRRATVLAMTCHVFANYSSREPQDPPSGHVGQCTGHQALHYGMDRMFDQLRQHGQRCSWFWHI
jgi:hypothetical protein